MGSAFAAYGIRRLMDSAQGYYKAGLPLYYRTRNFSPDSTVAQEMGLSFANTNDGSNDLRVCPQPGIRLLSSHAIAAAVAAGVALRAGARVITLSHTWVTKVQAAAGFANPRQVFNDPTVVGFFSDGLLFSIVSFEHSDVYGTILDWVVMVNANEIK